MMVGESMLHDFDSAFAQRVENPAWVADTGHGVHAGACEPGQ